MIKHYKANTNVSINVVLESKKNLHVTFVPLSDGSSRFTTDNEDIQKAIENHYKFGKLFRLVGEENIAKKKKIIRVTGNAKEKKDTPEPTEDTSTTTQEDAEAGEEVVTEITETTEETVEDIDEDADEENTEQEARVVKVSDIAAAKDYLADTFGISRTALRSKKAIVESGAANGIVFEGLD